MKRIELVVVMLIASRLGAQQTWIVDPNGTGQFTGFAMAVAAASPGDTLLLRGGGAYIGFHTLGKALCIVGDGPQRSRIFGVSSGAVASGGEIAISGVDIDHLTLWANVALEDVRLMTCQVHAPGNVALHRCTIGGTSTHFGNINTGGGLYVTGGNVVVSQCTGFGSAAWVWSTLQCTVYSGRPPVEVVGGTVTIAGSTLFGANSMLVFCNGIVQSSPSPALSVTGGAATVTQSSLSGGTSPTGAAQSVYLHWFGTQLLVDPTTSFSPAFTGGTSIFMPATTGQGAVPGGSMVCRVEGPPQQLAVLVANLGLCTPVRLPIGTAWVDPTAYVMLAFGITDASGFLGANIAIPVGVQRGLVITTQGVVLNGTALAAATPAILHVR